MNDRDRETYRRKALHDLRTPLNQIIGYSELLEEETQASGKLEWTDDLRKIREAAKKLMQLIEMYFKDPEGIAGHSNQLIPSFDSASKTTPAAGEDSGSILVVDDNEMNRDLLARRLTRLGYETNSRRRT